MMDSHQVKKLEFGDFMIENNVLKGTTASTDLSRKVGQHIFDVLNEYPKHVSQIDAETDRQTTFAEMRDQSIRCALWMMKENISCNDVIVVCTNNHLDSYIPVFATFFIEATFSAWEYQLTLYSARRFMKQFQPKIVFACKQSLDVLVEASELEKVDCKIVVFGKHATLQSLDEILALQTIKETKDFVPRNVKNLDDVAVVTLSSGTTGFPKGVMLSNKGLLNMLRLDDASMCKNNRFLWYATLDWISGLCFMLRCTLKQDTRIIPIHNDSEHFCQMIEKYQIFYALIYPYTLSSLVRFDEIQKYNLKSLKIISITGFKVPKELLERARKIIPFVFLNQVYAATEIGAVTFSNHTKKSIDSNGFISANFQMKIVDPSTGEILGPNKQGELYVRSPCMMLGYYKDPEETKKCFDEEGWFQTGDLGYYDENGEIFLIDRLKNIIEYQYIKVYPAEIEQVLLSHPDVEEAAVIPISHEIDRSWPTAFVKKCMGSKVNEDELMEFTAVLEDHKKLRGGIHFVDCLPKTASGKIKRSELIQMSEELSIKTNGYHQN